MPRTVDPGERRLEILDTAFSIIGESGLQALTFRRIAQRLGGSSTLVTHYYRTRSELISEVTSFSLERGRRQLRSIEQDVFGPEQRLRTLLWWLVPDDEEGRREERARFHLTAARDLEPDVQKFLDGWETEVRSQLRQHLLPLLPEQDVAPAVDLLRALTNGLCISAVEHPDLWTRDRLAAVVDGALRGVLLGVAGSPTP